LRHAAGQGWTLGHDIAVFACGQRNEILVRHGITPMLE
jgi:hypothetical protein